MTSNRYSYGYNKRNASINTDPNKFVAKLFSYYLHKLSHHIHKLLVNSREELNLEGVDLCTPFNHCTALLYYTDKSLKL